MGLYYLSNGANPLKVVGYHLTVSLKKINPKWPTREHGPKTKSQQF